jgi:NAD(P)-dependent dehydrogenase (short-subunit alcohol dehydrogenase family)
MDLRLDEKRALVTGATAGTGVAIAKALAAEGASVVVHGRNAQRAEKVAGEIRGDGGKAAVVLGDLGGQEGANEVAERALAAFGGLEILVNNAGAIGHYQSWDDTTEETWAEFYDGVAIVIFRMVKALLPHLRSVGWGRVVNIASAQGGQPFAMMPDYAAAKLAVLNLSKSLSKELDRTGVTVNTVSPGIIATETIRERLTEAARREGRSTRWKDVEDHTIRTELDNPTGRMARPGEVADLVAFLCSPRAGYINGANVRIDGGSNVTVGP